MIASRRRYTLLWFIGGVLAVVCLGITLGSMQALASAPGSKVSNSPLALRSANKPVGVPRSLLAPGAPANPDSCPGNYQVVQLSAGTEVSGTDLALGSQCDDCEVPITLPFMYNFYGQPFPVAVASVNGQIAFGTPSDHSYTNYCLPDPNTNFTIFPYWRDLSMAIDLEQCIDIGCGIYSSTTGTQPNRIFNIEYRAISLFTYNPIYFEVRLYENQARFDIIYSGIDSDTPNATIGVQRDTGSVLARYQCPNTGTLAPGTMLVFGYVDDCPPTPTPTPGTVLVGHVTWQGRPAQPNPANALPVTLTMRLQGGASSNYTGLSTDASGFFTVPVGSLPNGTYNWRVKSAQAGAGQTDYNPGFLSTSGSVNLTGAQVTNVEMGLQLSGDSDNNDRVTAIDFIALKVSFGQEPGQPNWDRRADYDGNNRITAVDFIQLKVNFGHDGSPPIRPSP